MRVLGVIGVIVGVISLTQGFKLSAGTTTPEKLPLNERIIQGLPAADLQFPHHGYLLVTLESGAMQACGASLIANRWALTAAHCVEGADFVEIYLGSNDINATPVRMTTPDIQLHPEFDLALIGLPGSAIIGGTIKTVNISRDPLETYEGQLATASGYGYIADGGPTSSTLNYVSLRVISNAECANYYGPIIVPSTICTVGFDNPTQGVCSGDSGGPLVVGSGDDMTLIGVTSFVSSAGCSSDGPSGFVRPSHFVSWLHSIAGI